MNIIRKYILLWLCADNKPSTPLQIELGLKLLARIDDFKELREAIEKIEGKKLES